MKYRKMKLNLFFLIFLLVGCFTGCENKSDLVDDDKKTVALVIIAGRHANAKMYTEKMISSASEYIKASYKTTRDSNVYIGSAQISVIVCDGDPRKVAVELDGRDILTYQSGNKTDIDNKKSNLVPDLTDFLLSPSLKADDQEVDLLLALSRAQDILNDYPDCEHHILILDTGITTTGYLDMNKINILSSECSQIIDEIKPGIPHLNGTEVTFLGLGNVAFPQSCIISTDGKDRIEELWRSIIEAGEGTLTPNCLNYNDTENTEEMVFSEDGGDDVYEYVSSVSFYNADSGGVEPNPVEIKHEEKNDEPTVTLCFQTSDLGGFVPDEATFLHRDVAISMLNSLQKDLNEFLNTTDKKLYIVGSIARTSPDADMTTSTVSQARAHAVADLLINDYNVPENRIVTIDAGTTQFSWRNAVEYPDGTSASYDKRAAQKNRVVAIISENSSLIEELKPNYIN